MANPLYDKTYTDTRTISGVTVTTKFESHIAYGGGAAAATVTVKASQASGLMCRMSFYKYDGSTYPMTFTVTNEYAPAQNTYIVGYIDQNSGTVDGYVTIKIYRSSDGTTLGEYDISYYDIFVHVDVSDPIVDRFVVTTNYLGTVPSVSFKVRHPYLRNVAFHMITDPGEGELGWNEVECSASAYDETSLSTGVVDYTYTGWSSPKRWSSGYTYRYKLYASLSYGHFTVMLDEGTITFDSKVESIVMNSLSQMSVGQTQQVIYTQKKPDGATGPFKYPGVTFTSSNTAAATINSSGVITAVGNGTTTIKVISDDPWPSTVDPLAENPFDEKTLVVTPTPGTFPTLENDYTRITKADMDNFIAAEGILKAQLEPSSWETLTFNGYAHSVFEIYELIEDIITNLQYLTAKYLADHPSSSAAQTLNQQAQNCTIERENALLPGQDVHSWRATFRTIAQTLTALADLVL